KYVFCRIFLDYPITLSIKQAYIVIKKRLEGLGLHVLIEYYGIDSELGSKAAAVEEMMLTAAQTAGMQYLHHYFHQFSPFGVTGIIAVQESHLSIHTWPEHQYAAVDMFTCGDQAALRMAIEEIGKKLKASSWEVMEVSRGGSPNAKGWQQRMQTYQTSKVDPLKQDGR
ncbi:MAG: adenosylmethionine decarboxylase, partial [Bacteroidota bacterium]